MSLSDTDRAQATGMQVPAAAAGAERDDMSEQHEIDCACWQCSDELTAAQMAIRCQCGHSLGIHWSGFDPGIYHHCARPDCDCKKFNAIALDTDAGPTGLRA